MDRMLRFKPGRTVAQTAAALLAVDREARAAALDEAAKASEAARGHRHDNKTGKPTITVLKVDDTGLESILKTWLSLPGVSLVNLVPIAWSEGPLHETQRWLLILRQES